MLKSQTLITNPTVDLHPFYWAEPQTLYFTPKRLHYYTNPPPPPHLKDLHLSSLLFFMVYIKIYMYNNNNITSTTSIFDDPKYNLRTHNKKSFFLFNFFIKKSGKKKTNTHVMMSWNDVDDDHVHSLLAVLLSISFFTLDSIP